MVAEQVTEVNGIADSCSLAKISMVAEPDSSNACCISCCSLAKISMVAEPSPYIRFLCDLL